jgi:uncharacterized protein (TIGR01440 family)
MLPIQTQTTAILQELAAAYPLDENKLVVFGVSTSEVLGTQIGKGGSEEVAAEIFAAIDQWQQQSGCMLAFQCCEHLNRALVVTRQTAEYFRLTEVAAVPVAHAGGAMAAYAYRHLPQSVLVEEVAAHAAIDIGHTLIGMHLRPVAVPLRPKESYIGHAHVTMAFTRPKLIGGKRAVYQ